MFVNKLLSNSRDLFRRHGLPCKNNGLTIRGKHYMNVPARNKITGGELFAYGVLMWFSMWSIPAWILYYLPEYQGEDRTKYTGK